jgi:hypothetical protein
LLEIIGYTHCEDNTEGGRISKIVSHMLVRIMDKERDLGMLYGCWLDEFIGRGMNKKAVVPVSLHV